MSTENLKVPPDYCEYSDGPCDQDFSDLGVCDGFFLYPSNPTAIASTIESAVQILQEKYPEKSWKLWKTLNIPGRVIFCEICKQARGSTCIIADVTTFNFNLLFEIGFSLGLGLPVIPIRDTTYELNKREFAELGVLDTLGYLDFTNSAELAKKLAEALPGSPFGIREETVSRESPLYVLKGPIETDGAVKLMSTLKKSGHAR